VKPCKQFAPAATQLVHNHSLHFLRGNRSDFEGVLCPNCETRANARMEFADCMVKTGPSLLAPSVRFPMTVGAECDQVRHHIAT
jgi:hypothetical protein